MGMNVRSDVGYGFIVPSTTKPPEGVLETDDWYDDMMWHIEQVIDRRGHGMNVTVRAIGDHQSGADNRGVFVCVWPVKHRASVEWGDSATFDVDIHPACREAVTDVRDALGLTQLPIGWVLAGYVG